MKDETLERVLAAVKEELKAANLPPIEEAIKVQVAVLMGRPVERKHVTRAYLAIAVFSTMEGAYRKQPELTAAQFHDFLVKIRDLRFLIRDEILEIGKKMPHRLGGAKPKLNLKEKHRLCKLIGELMVGGRTHSEAVIITAERYSVSKRTIERIWEKRAGI